MGATADGVPSRRRLPAPVLTLVGWLVGLGVTAGILGTPYLLYAYNSPELHLVLETVDGVVALLVAMLLYGRFVRSGRLQDALLSQGLFLLALAGLGLTLLLDVLHGGHDRSFDVWMPLTIRVTGALLIAGAGLVGGRLARPGLQRWVRVLPWLVVLLAFVVLWSERGDLPAAVAESPPASAERPVIAGHPALLGAQVVAALAFAVGSVGFTVHAARHRDELLRWVGPALALGSCARLNYLLFPSIYSDWIYTGDVLRTGCYFLLFIGGAREVRHYWAAQAATAVLEDRRRLARELHDGVVQELGYIRAEAHGLARDPEAADAARRIVASSDRALDEARAAVDALGRSTDEPLGELLRLAAQQVAERHGGELDADVDPAVTADTNQRHALVRITREAVSNALRHGGARKVELRVAQEDGRRVLVVRDDGTGFDVDATHRRSSGYGLVSMRERARALPGSWKIESSPMGTEVRVEW